MSETKRSWLVTANNNVYLIVQVKNQLIFFQFADEQRQIKLKANFDIPAQKRLKTVLCSGQFVIVCLEDSLKIIDLGNYEFVSDIEVQGKVHSLLRLPSNTDEEEYIAMIVNTKRSAVVYLLRSMSVVQEFQIDDLVINSLVCDRK